MGSGASAPGTRSVHGLERLDEMCGDESIENASRVSQAEVAGLERGLEIGQARRAGRHLFEKDAVAGTQVQSGRPLGLGSLERPARVLRALRVGHRVAIPGGGLRSGFGDAKAVTRLPGNDSLRIPPVVTHGAP